ncbi:hypothetical protein BTH42_06575 [Burkholderia sp. SRS-W-2-2016]|uniref:DUF4148 domain-containing protein n=1 Tax=Burkholderia sp. SRS-W-2-2016 TaxID=1926878 RepID=UPI00094B040C|nr:DUF4148 domain-containing protein [Burkholderia sp. SRS-W-2-2016]OLL32479.1 hypothetical protein BTH42_06575 [Burkholderia sp. SRS-W-2-2016]
MKAARFAVIVLAASVGSTILSPAAFAQAKTREQVKAELIQAQHEGVTPTTKTQYPPTPDNLERQKQLHVLTTHAGEAAPGLDQHDNLASRR